MAFQYKTLIRIAPAALLVLAFQNCSSPKFSATNASSEKSFTDSTITPTDGSGATDGTGPTGTNTPPAPPQQPSSTQQPPSSQPPSTHEAQHSGPCAGHEDPEQDSNQPPSVDHYRQACDDLRRSKKTVVLADGLNIENKAGIGRYIAGRFGEVSDVSGTLTLGCNKDGGTVDSVSDSSGITVICGCDVGTIDNHSGKTIVVDGNVGSVVNSSGLVLVGGKITGVIDSNSGKVISH